MAVVGDAPKGGTKLDARSITRLLAASQEVGASQFVLVTRSGSASVGGGVISMLRWTPMQCWGSIRPSSRLIIEPQSPPWAP